MNRDEMQEVLSKHVAWVSGKRDGKHADLRRSDLRRSDLSGANLSGANLSGANLSGANLSEADLRHADLWRADLRRATLRRADLRWADLRRATLRRADLRWADLGGADLRRADLRWADLGGADLRRADLSGANLWGADLRHANLSEADLSGANLSGTIIDPRNLCPDATAAVIEAGMSITTDEDGIAWVNGWRTKKSVHVGDTVYCPGRYQAPVFSTDTKTDCHPGIYFASKRWLMDKYPISPIVPIVARLSQVVVTINGKFRARELWVLE